MIGVKKPLSTLSIVPPKTPGKPVETQTGHLVGNLPLKGRGKVCKERNRGKWINPVLKSFRRWEQVQDLKVRNR